MKKQANVFKRRQEIGFSVSRIVYFTETDILQSIAYLITLIQVSNMRQRKTFFFANDQFPSSLKLKQVKVLHRRR